MGYIKHNAAIITSWDVERLEAAHIKAREIFKAKFEGGARDLGASILVSEIVHGVVNSQASFFIAPDGSKEGWADSTKSDEARKEFLDWIIQSENFSDYIEVRFGGDDEFNEVTRSKQSDLDSE